MKSRSSTQCQTHDQVDDQAQRQSGHRSERQGRRGFLAGAVAGTALLVTTGARRAQAANYPVRPIQVTVPYEPGGTSDVVFRAIVPALEKELGQPVVVLNRSGASGLIGTEQVARAAPDGYNLVVVTAGHPIAVAYSTNKLGFDLRKDFVPIAAYADTPYFLFVNSERPINSVQELIAAAKAQPGKLTYGSSGAGQSGHLAGARFAQAAGIDMLHVPYKGTGPAMTDLAAGHIDTILVGLPIAQPHLKSGRVRVLAVAAPERVTLRPDLPSIQEAGVPGFQARAWYGLLAPAGTPPEIRDRLSAAVVKVMAQPESTERFAAMGAVPMALDAEAFAGFFRKEIDDTEAFIRGFPGGLK